MSRDNDDNLPVVRDEERIERLKEMHEKLERGDADEILVPIEAHDVGDEDVRANPRASDLGYVEGGGEVAVASNLGGSDRIMYDPDSEESSETKIECDADTFVDDVADWA
jgi:hypothetical protein